VGQLQGQLMAAATDAGETTEQLQEELNDKLKENEVLSSELTVLRATVKANANANGDNESDPMIQIAKDIEEMKQEHRIEIKMLKKEHASIKTKAKLVAKERDQLADAYEVERTSNNDLETSLDELVTLLQAERKVLSEKTKEVKTLKKKCKILSKKRVPVEAAYEAGLARLERPEDLENLTSKRSDDDGQEVTKAIKLIENLTLALDEQSGSESSLASISESFSSENKHLEELAGKCEAFEIKVRALKLKLETDCATYRDENGDLRKRIEQLTKAASECQSYIKDNSALREKISKLAQAESDRQMYIKENGDLREKIDQLGKAASEHQAYAEENSGLKRMVDELSKAVSPSKSPEEMGALTNPISKEHGAEPDSLREGKQTLEDKMKQISNGELETSLEELVKLLQNERTVHVEETAKLVKELKTVAKECASLRKKRVPIEAAYEAIRARLDCMESREVSVVAKTVQLIDGLMSVLDERADSESSSAYMLEIFSSDNHHMEELVGKCETIEVKIRTLKLEMASKLDAHCEGNNKLREIIGQLIKTALEHDNDELKEKIDQLAKAVPPSKSLEDSASKSSPFPKELNPEVDALHKANHTLKERSKNLTRELVDSTKAFEETIKSYETVIAKVKNALSEKKQENEYLKDEMKELADSNKSAEEAIASYESVIDDANNALSEKEQENEALQNDLDEAKNALASLESDMDVGITSYESAIVEVKNALSEKVQENEGLQNDLKNAKIALAELESNMDVGITSYESAIEKVKNALSEKRQENETLQKDLDRAKHALVDLGVEMEVVMSEDVKSISALEELQAESLQKHEEDLDAYREAVEVLKNKLEETSAVINQLQAENKKLKIEVSKRKGDFTAVISEFEQEMKLSCESSEAALQLAREECEATKTALREKEEECTQLTSELAECEGNERESAGLLLEHETANLELREELSNKESEIQELEKSKDELIDKIASLTDCIAEEAGRGETLIDENTRQEEIIHELREELSTKESQRQELEKTKNKLKSSLTDALGQLRNEAETHQTETEQLTSQLNELREELDAKQSKLDGAMLSIEDNMQLYESLRADCAKLKEEKETAKEALEVASAEKEDLLSQLEVKSAMQAELEDSSTKIDELLKTNHEAQNEVESLKKEVHTLTGENVQMKQAAESTENQLGSLREDIRLAEGKLENAVLATEAAEEGRRQAVLAATATKEELRKVTSSYSDMTARNGRNEKQVRSLKEELEMALLAQQKANSEVDAAKEDLLKTTKKLDDFVSYTDGLKVDHMKTSTSLKREMNEQMSSMNEVVKSLQHQIETLESDKKENIRMYENDISLQQKEVETLKLKYSDAQNNLDSLSGLVTNLKAALESEKGDAQILLQQFKQSEQDRKSYIQQKEELEAELASRLKSETEMTEKICNLEGVEKELASRMKSETIMTERIRYLETELQELRPVIRAREDELEEVRASMMENENVHNAELAELKAKIDQDKRKYTTMQERISSMDAHTKSLQQEFKRTIHEKEKEGAKLRVVLQEAKDKLGRLWEENSDLKKGNNESMESMQHMLNDAIRSRASTDTSLQESLQLLEQQKRIDIKRKGEIAKLEQTVEILKSKERYLESYVASLKKQIRRG